MCVSSLECSTKAVSSTCCHTIWPIRETHREGVCLCASVISGRFRRSVWFFSAVFHCLSQSPLFTPPSFVSPLEFRVYPSGMPPSLSPVPSGPETWGVKAITSRGETVREMDRGRDVCAIMSNNMKADGGREAVEER